MESFFIYTMTEVIIRAGIKTDLPQVLELIKEHATYEKAPQEVTNTVSKMEEDGFAEKPLYGFFVAECEQQIVGLSLYYYRYSTWKGKRLYLEDIIVTEKARGKKIGKWLFERTMKFAVEQNCSGLTWQVLNWNEPAINFYKKYNPHFDDERTNGNIEVSAIKNYFEKIK